MELANKTTTYNVDKQGPSIKQGNYIQYIITNRNGRESESRMCITESLCYAETNAIL